MGTLTKLVYYVASVVTPSPRQTWRLTELFRDQPITTWEDVQALAAWLDEHPEHPGNRHTVVAFSLLRTQELTDQPPDEAH